MILKNQNKLLSAAFVLLCFCHPAKAELVVTHRSPETAEDTRESYNIALISLALEKTKQKYGNYRLQGMPSMNRPRALYSVSMQIYPNILIEESYDDFLGENKDITHIDFPIDLGIIGYRICFVTEKLKAEVANTRTLDQLKKYNIGQGIGWADVKILRDNGFHVTEIGNYDSLFKMTVAGRIDLFCRGINELPNEVAAFKNIVGLTYDESFLLTYEMPRFFYTNIKNVALKNRMEEGLGIAWKDGSLLKLWLQYNQKSIEFANVKKRRVFHLKNRATESLKTSYKEFYYFPFQ